MSLKILSGSITRPADTTDYAAGDVIGTAATHLITLTADGLLERGKGIIFKSSVISTASPATLASLELWLLKRPIAAQADNAAFAITDAEAVEVIAAIPLTNTRVGLASGNTVYESAENAAYGFELPVFVKNLTAVLVVRNAYVPISAEVFTVNVSVDFD